MERQKNPTAGGGSDAGELEALSGEEPERPVTRQGAPSPGGHCQPNGAAAGTGTGTRPLLGSAHLLPPSKLVRKGPVTGTTLNGP